MLRATSMAAVMKDQSYLLPKFILRYFQLSGLLPRGDEPSGTNCSKHNLSISLLLFSLVVCTHLNSDFRIGHFPEMENMEFFTLNDMMFWVISVSQAPVLYAAVLTFAWKVPHLQQNTLSVRRNLTPAFSNLLFLVSCIKSVDTQ